MSFRLERRRVNGNVRGGSLSVDVEITAARSTFVKRTIDVY